MSNIWYMQFGDKWISKSVELKLKDQFKQQCLAEVNSSPKGLCYRIFKRDIIFEKYFSILANNFLFTLCKFRCGNHRLPIETGRWHNLDRDNRLCHLCDSNDLGDEYHYIMVCSAFKVERKKFFA